MYLYNKQIGDVMQSDVTAIVSLGIIFVLGFIVFVL